MVTTSALVEIVLMVADVERSVSFYRDVLGLKVISPPLGGPVFLQVGGDKAGVPDQIVLAPRPPGTPDQPASRAHRAFYHLGLEIAGEDIGECRKRLEALGYEVRSGDHPFLPFDAIYVDDPDGNEIELVQRRKQ